MNTDKTIETPQSPRISVAPMMDWTTKDYRFFARLFNPNVILYTEMVTTGAILFGGANRHLYTKSYFSYYGVKFGVNANGFTHLNTGSNKFSQVAEYRLKV